MWSSKISQNSQILFLRYSQTKLRVSFVSYCLFNPSTVCIFGTNCPISVGLKPNQYPNRKCQKTKYHIFQLQTHFAWSHHISSDFSFMLNLDLTLNSFHVWDRLECVLFCFAFCLFCFVFLQVNEIEIFKFQFNWHEENWNSNYIFTPIHILKLNANMNVKLQTTVGILARLRCHRPFIFLWTHNFQLRLTITRPLGRTCIHNGLKISQWKIIDNVPFFPPNYWTYRVTCFKLAGELANRTKLKPTISDLSQDLLKRVFSHHRHDINKVVAKCLLTGNFPSWSHRQNDMGVEPLKIGMDPLKLVFYTFKGSKRSLLFGR